MNGKTGVRCRVACGAAFVAFGLVGMTFGDTEVSSVEELIDAVSSSAAGATIRIKPGTYDLTGKFALEESYPISGGTVSSRTHLNINKALSFVGNDTDHWATENAVILTGNGRFCKAVSGVTFTGITFKGFKACENPNATPSGGNLTVLSLGGAISGTASASNCVFSGCNARSGGAVASSNGTFTDCKFIGCTASYNGGAGIYGDYVSCLFATNSAQASGALWWPVVCRGCTFEGNRATGGAGGAVSMENTKTMTNCTFLANAAVSGGALNLRPNDKVLGCTFIRNTATLNGGAINGSRSNSATDANGCRGSVIGNCTFVENSADGLGGAVYDELNGVNLPMDVYGCAFTNNTSDKGGAMFSGRARTSVFFGNHANRGGAIYHNVGSHSNHWAVACNFVSNYVTGVDVDENRPASGGAIYDGTLGTSWQASYRAHDCRFEGNHAILAGGAVFSGITSNCTYVGNYVTCDGGANNLGGGAVSGNGNVAGQIGHFDCSFTGNYCLGSGLGGAGYDAATGSGSHLKFERCAFSNNFTKTGGGGAIYGSCVSNCVFFGNHSNGNGGAIQGQGNAGNQVVHRCFFVSNYVERTTKECYGAAIFETCGVEISGCAFTGNFCTNNASTAGGIVSGGWATLADCAFTNNFSWKNGIVGKMNCTNVVFYHNEHLSGSGVLANGTAVGCRFVANTRFDTFYRLLTEDQRKEYSGTFEANVPGGDAFESTLTRCDLDGGIIYHCVLNDCHIHDCTNAGVYCVFYGNNIATNCLISNAHDIGYAKGGTLFRGIFYWWGSTENTWPATGGNRSEFVNCTFADCRCDQGYLGRYYFCYDNYAGERRYLFKNCLFYDNRRKDGTLMDLSFWKANALAAGTPSGIVIENCVCGVAPTITEDWTFVQNAVKTIAPEALGILKGEKAKEKGVADYTLRYGSPARGLGDASIWGETATDLAGNLRKRNGKVDPGCYECWIDPVGMTLLIR